MAETPLAHLAQPGTQITVRVTPRAARTRITHEDGQIRVYVTTVPEDGKANAAVQKALAKAKLLALGRQGIDPLRQVQGRRKIAHLRHRQGHFLNAIGARIVLFDGDAFLEGVHHHILLQGGRAVIDQRDHRRIKFMLD
jgi:uncharacterized protein YggU (UPF0235/DUF167 family)